MAVTIRITDISCSDLRTKLEAVIGEGIGTKRQWKEWAVSIDGPRLGASGHCRIVVEPPGQRRQRVFYEEGDKLIEEIRAWLNLYPFW